VVYLGGTNCTYTGTRIKPLRTTAEPSSETSLLSAITIPTPTSTDTPLASGTPNPSRIAEEMPQPESTISTEEKAIPVISNESEFVPPFKLPMEG
jgi:hypothetical protein